MPSKIKELISKLEKAGFENREVQEATEILFIRILSDR